jgi:hypothetical protein
VWRGPGGIDGRLPGQRGTAAVSLEIMLVRLPRSVTPAAAFVAAAIVVAACGSSSTPIGSGAPPSTAPSGTPAPSGSPAVSPSPALATLLLEVTSEGGFINPSATLAALPTVAVYADGRIVSPGVVDASAPGPLLPPVVVRNVRADGAAAILAAIKQAGLDKQATGGPGIPGDSGTSVFTAVVDGTTTTTRLAGGGPPGPGAGSGDPERAAALGLLSRLLDPTQSWGAAAAPQTPFAPVGYRIFVAPADQPTGLIRGPVQWPLATPLDAFGTPAVPDRGMAGLRQGVVLGPDAALIGPVLQAATADTQFASGGKNYTLHVRPLLPDELGG